MLWRAPQLRPREAACTRSSHPRPPLWSVANAVITIIGPCPPAMAAGPSIPTKSLMLEGAEIGTLPLRTRKGMRSGAEESRTLAWAVASARSQSMARCSVEASLVVPCCCVVGACAPSPPGVKRWATVASGGGRSAFMDARADMPSAIPVCVGVAAVPATSRAAQHRHGRRAGRGALAVTQHGGHPRAAQMTQVRLTAPLGSAVSAVEAGGRRPAASRVAGQGGGGGVTRRTERPRRARPRRSATTRNGGVWNAGAPRDVVAIIGLGTGTDVGAGSGMRGRASAV